jgi:4-hydroxy-tetrahydrodipicolinate synthase
VKAALELAGLIGPEMRLPMVPVSGASRTRIADVLRRRLGLDATGVAA